MARCAPLALCLAAAAWCLGSAAASPDAAGGVASLCLQSRVGLPVLLSSSCTENRTLEAGGALTLNATGEKTFWVVPSGAYWDCELGCAECFYVSVRVLPSGEAAATVGFGVRDGEGANATGRGNETLEAASGMGDGARGTLLAYLDENTTGLNITGLRLSATAPARNGSAAQPCAGGDCNSTLLANLSTCIGLAVEGPRGGQPTLLSRWGHWGGHHGHWHHHHHHHHHHHWGHHGWHHRRWCRWHCAWGRCWNRCW